MRRILFLIAGITMVVTLSVQAHAQDEAGMSSPVPSSSAEAVGPEKMSGFGKDANYVTLEEQQHGGMRFTGKVIVEDAMFPWDPIPVIVTCKGVVRYRTEADAKGGFEIRGRGSSDPILDSEVVPKAGAAKQATASQLIGCDIAAAMPGFKSTSLHIANQNIMDNPDLGTITIHPDNSATASSMSASTTTASPDAMKKFNKARSEWINSNTEAAEKDLQKAVQSDPKFAEAWYELGKMQQANNKYPDALNSYQKAAAADPKFVSPYERIAEMAAQLKQWQTVENATSTALKLDPTGTPQLWYFDAVGKFNTGDADGAEASARKSMAMDPQHTEPNTEQLLAVILASKGELAEALQHLKNSLTYIKPGPNADLIKQQIAQLEKALPAGGSN